MFEAEAQQVRTTLALSAREHAREALLSYKNDDELGFYLRAGTALELAIKARLVSHHFALIAPAGRDWFDHLIRLARPSDSRASRSTRTVEARQALARLRLLEPSFDEAFDQRVTETLDRWNQVKHLGLSKDVPPNELVAHAAAFVQAVAVLLRQDFDQFWDYLAPTARAMLDEGVTQASVAVAEATAVARDAFNSLAPADVERLRAEAIEASKYDDPSATVPTECPVCDSIGASTGVLIDDGYADHGGGREDGYHWVRVPVLEIRTFGCPVCGLRLDKPDLVKAAGLPLRRDDLDLDPDTLEGWWDALSHADDNV